MMFFSASVRRDALSAVQLHTAARTAITNPPAKIRLLIPVFIFNIISDKKYKISQLPRQINMPSSQKYLSTVIQAIRDGKAINVTYQSFRKQAPETLVLEPYFLREYKRKYFKSLPLHQSQEIIEETPEYTVFKYFLTPDWDFRQDVLSFGTRVEVLEPERVRKEIGEMASALNKLYNN